MIQNFEFHRSLDNMLAIQEWWARLNTLEQVGVVTALLELHQNVMQLHSIFITASIDSSDVAGNNIFINFFLSICQTNCQMDFLFVWNVVFNINTKSSKHERSKQSLDLVDYFFLFLRVFFLSIGHSEQGFEILRGIK